MPLASTANDQLQARALLQAVILITAEQEERPQSSCDHQSRQGHLRPGAGCAAGAGACPPRVSIPLLRDEKPVDCWVRLIAASFPSHQPCCVQGKRKGPSPPVTINADRNIYALGQDVLPVLERACQESIPVLRDEKPVDALTVRHGPETDDYNRDFIERDEKRLADLGRRTVEMYVIAHIIADLEVRYMLNTSACAAVCANQLRIV